jgi:hypothetical protein
MPSCGPAELYERFLEWMRPAVASWRHERADAPGSETTTHYEGVALNHLTDIEARKDDRLAPGDLVGVAEIYDLFLKVCRERVLEITCRDDFPEPAAILIGGYIWLREDVEGWLEEHGDVVADLFKATR